MSPNEPPYKILQSLIFLTFSSDECNTGPKITFISFLLKTTGYVSQWILIKMYLVSYYYLILCFSYFLYWGGTERVTSEAKHYACRLSVIITSNLPRSLKNYLMSTQGVFNSLQVKIAEATPWFGILVFLE